MLGENNISVSLACHESLVCHFRAVLGVLLNGRNLTVSNGELGNWQVTLVCDRTSPLDTLGNVHAGV